MGALLNSFDNRSISKNSKKESFVKIVLYTSPLEPPQIFSLPFSSYEQIIDIASNKTFELICEQKGCIPYPVIREMVENFIHADFQNAVISILNEGNTIIFSDQGKGIQKENWEKIFRPGFSTASIDQQQFIKGVGSGLFVVSEIVKNQGGEILINSNIEKGIVFVIDFSKNKSNKKTVTAKKQNGIFLKSLVQEPFHLNNRQWEIIKLALKISEIGPSQLNKALGISISTAYRELIALEEKGFMENCGNGKRCLTKKAYNFIHSDNS
jgi:predicted HTH transcriptional regulator